MPDDIAGSHLITRQTDPLWLKRVAIEEFISARNTRRIIAFVGSFASEHLGYNEWSDMWAKFCEILNDVKPALNSSKSEVFEFLVNDIISANPAFDKATTADVLEHLCDIDEFSDSRKFIEFRKDFIRREFSIDNRTSVRRSSIGIIRALYEDLGIDRYLTTNYDIEIELELMTVLAERGKKPAATLWGELLETGHPNPDDPPRVRRDGHRYWRHISGRGKIVSDIAERDQYQRLVELALRQPSYHAHILHLHGRADDAKNALVTRRDYRDRYVQDVPTRLPFNFASRQLFLGNPILFVGIGAREPDVMRALEEHLSNNPNRRDTATFLLWTSSEKVAEDDARRIWFYRQYGIHLLFDHEIAALAREAPVAASKDEAEKKQIAAERMAAPLDQLARLAGEAAVAQRWEGRRFRSARVKYNLPSPGTGKPAPQHVRIWQLHADAKAAGLRFSEPEDVADKMAASPRIKLVTAASGRGRGSCAAALADAILQRYRTLQKNGGGKFRVISISGAFTTELDSVFSVLSGAYDAHTADEDRISRFQALEKMFAMIEEVAKGLESSVQASHTGQVRQAAEDTTVTIIINGVERFIAHDGVSLSNELDNLIRRILKFTGEYRTFERLNEALDALRSLGQAVPDFPVNLVLLGTDRVVRYLSRLNGHYDHWVLDDKPDPKATPVPGTLWLRPKGGSGGALPSYEIEGARNYFGDIVATYEKLEIPILFDPNMSDRTLKRQRFFDQVLEPNALSKAGVENVPLALEILRVLAFIGQPSEPEILRHVPYVLNASADPSAEIERAVARLIALGLVLKIEHFDPAAPPAPPLKDYRLGLNKALTMELRERYGVPLAESRLSASFNLSLFAAQPFDNYVPDNNWHDELGQMVDWLLSASREPVDPPFPEEQVARLQDEAFWRGTPEGVELLQYQTPDRLVRMIGPEVGYCLRAALALLRGYYSVPALLMLDNRTLDPLMRHGPLTEYAERLTRLIRVYDDVMKARGAAARCPELRPLMGHDPLYADDVLWILNELGVAKLTQGDLYRARFALEQAIRINRQYVEFDDRQQNWCRLELNCVFLDIERGKIGAAEERLRDIESAINEQAIKVNATDSVGAAGWKGRFKSPFEEIVDRYAFSENKIDSVGADDMFPTDLILSTALILGYRGICLHLRGSLAPSLGAFKNCLNILHRLGEQRAYSFFQRHTAGVYHSLGKPDSAADALKLCVAAAGPTRHPDIDHDGRIGLILYDLNCDLDSKIGQERIPQLMESRRYARASDMYRLQLEAAQTLALVHFGNGDHDSALRYVSDALSIAARTGIALRKISLRILFARIVSARGDRAQALELIETAMILATRIGYERAVETAENVRIKLESR